MSEASKSGGNFRWWWPAILMMAFIFVGSTDLGAASHQSRFLLPILQWLGFGEAAIRGIIFTIRKCAHLTEYALLAIFLWRAWMRRPAFRPPVTWSWRDTYPAFLFCAAFAALDELHQAFVPSRSASGWDVMIDSVGAAIGILLLWWWHGSQSAVSVK